MATCHLAERHRGEHQQHDELIAQQRLLHAGRELYPAPADPGHRDDPHDRADDDHPVVVQAVAPAEQLVGVDGRDVGQGGHHDHIGEEDHPAVDPADLRAQSARAPCEGGAAVGVCAVEVLVGGGDQQHRHKRGDHHPGRGGADALDRDDETQCGGERVGGSDGRGADHQVGQKADRAALEALVCDLLLTRLADAIWKLGSTHLGGRAYAFNTHLSLDVMSKTRALAMTSCQRPLDAMSARSAAQA
jgi:hypothetical protein